MITRVRTPASMFASLSPVRIADRCFRLARASAVVALGIAGACGCPPDALAQAAQGPASGPSPAAANVSPAASGVRAQTRLVSRRGTAVTEAQASELTLTLTVAAFRPIQIWIRTAGVLDGTGKILRTALRSPEAELVQVGQRVRTFSVKSRTQMVQAKITRVTPRPGGAEVEATLAAPVATDGSRQLMEIVTEQGPFLSVPNVSIIEEGGSRVVYVQLATGEYSPRTIHTGVEGELYTQVLDGLADGDQVVSIGSF